MARAQCIVLDTHRVLLVENRQDGVTWWCLPGGRIEEGETPEQAVLRELREECCVEGTIVRRTSHVDYGGGDETYSFLVDIGSQRPRLGHDPNLPMAEQVIVDVVWRTLAEIPERDRAFLWAAGLLGVPHFWAEVEGWGNRTSYPGGDAGSRHR